VNYVFIFYHGQKVPTFFIFLRKMSHLDSGISYEKSVAAQLTGFAVILRVSPKYQQKDFAK